MTKIRFERVVSVTSEIPGHLARNILSEEIDSKKNWLCEKGLGKAAVILQLERPTIVTSIHIGNAHSAFVEILVGKAADTSDRFESLVPVSSLMTPKDSVNGNNQNCTRLFTKADFSAESLGKAWDRIKVICTQPFNKQVPFGVCFIQVQGEIEAMTFRPKFLAKIQEDKKEDDIQIGSFFKKKRNSDGSKLPVQESSSQAEKESPSDKETRLALEKMKAKLSETLPKAKEAEKPSSSNENEKKIKKETLLPLKRKKEDENKVIEEKIKRTKIAQKKPFEKLLENVVFVLSGFQNPLRGNIRNLALEMGAKYSPDWADHCTHLVCACENTPKFKQVKGKGKIVKKEWLEKCHADRKRYPWRRFALDRNDAKQPESENEIEEEKAGEPTPSPQASQRSHSQTPPKTPRKTSQTAQVKSPEKNARSKVKATATASDQTEVDETEANDGGESSTKDPSLEGDEYSVSTDEDECTNEEDTTDYPMPFLPNLFKEKTFYVDPNLKSRGLLERYIVAYNGTLTEGFHEKVEFYLTDKGGPLLDVITKKVPNIVVVKPSWIREMNSKQKYTSPEPHLVK